jgi:hypothetical protein
MDVQAPARLPVVCPSPSHEQNARKKRLRARYISCSPPVHPPPSSLCEMLMPGVNRPLAPSPCLHVNRRTCQPAKKIARSACFRVLAVCPNLLPSPIETPTPDVDTAHAPPPPYSTSPEEHANRPNKVHQHANIMLAASGTTFSLIQNTALGIHATSAPFPAYPTSVSNGPKLRNKWPTPLPTSPVTRIPLFDIDPFTTRRHGLISFATWIMNACLRTTEAVVGDASEERVQGS